MTSMGDQRPCDTWAEGMYGLQAMKIDNDSTMSVSLTLQWATAA